MKGTLVQSGDKSFHHLPGDKLEVRQLLGFLLVDRRVQKKKLRSESENCQPGKGLTIFKDVACGVLKLRVNFTGQYRFRNGTYLLVHDLAVFKHQ